MSLPIIFKHYDYRFEISLASGTNLASISPPTVRISSAAIETETKLRWFIIRPAVYHNAFFNASSPANRQIPTQVTGAIAEAVTLRLFQTLFSARNIEKISERPSSMTADFAMDINWNSSLIHCLVESKGSNMPGGGSGAQLYAAREQLRNTEADRPETIDAKFATLVYFREKVVRVIGVQ